MLNRISFAAALAAAILAFPSDASAQAPPSGRELVARSRQAFYSAGPDMQARIQMRLIAADGRTRERELTMLRKNMGDGLQRYYMFFHRPADVRGTAFLVWADPGRDDERWIYVPALDLVRGIAARDSRASFVGSDFSYEDVSGRDVDADEHAVLGEEKLADRPVWKVESRPRSDAGYRRKVTWIAKDSYLPLREEYYDVRDELDRVFTADEVRNVDSGSGSIPTVIHRTMTNVKSGHHTEVAFETVAYGLGFNDAVFTEDALRRPPRDWIR